MIKAMACALGKIAWERPELLLVAVVQTFKLARPRWWARFPFLPIPSDDYLTFRLLTDYGSGGNLEDLCTDIVLYLDWCSQFKRS